MNTTRQYIDIGVIIPLEEELQEFFEVFSSKKDVSMDGILIHEINLDHDDISMVVILQNDMGHAATAEAAATILNKYKIGLIVSIGIAGGLSTDIVLGDVCYSGKVIDVYENCKAIDADDEENSLRIKFSPNHYETNPKVTRAFNFVRTQPALKSIYHEWQKNQLDFIKKFNLAPVQSRSGQEKLMSAPETKNGAIVCGIVTKSKAYNKQVEELERRVLAIETESGAIFQQKGAQPTEVITVRGISDYADSKKNALEESTGGAIRKIAARNAITFLKMQLSNTYFLNQVLSMRNSTQEALDFGFDEPSIDSVVDPVEELSLHIDSQLREYSPEYRLHPKGYRVPAPRIQRDYGTQSSVGKNYFPPTELRDALIVDRNLLVSVPRSFPDKSLAWVLAHDLLDAEYGGKQILPVVIDGDRISPPANGLSRLSPINLNSLATHDGFHTVFILDGIPLHSATRLAFLKEEALNREDCHFIFLSTNSPSLLREHDFTLELSLTVYTLCDVSFLEISNFIQRSFEMPTIQAEVVAKKLWDTFKTFDLSAHPTYFAGIPRETLMALLHANKRAELIQLAVDGFLTVVVAHDTATIALSRTTRSRFLSDLVEEIHLKGRSFNVQDLISYVDSFALKQDFDIDAMDFLNSFRDKGILHFDGGLVSFTLPFIERYLLAKRLSEKKELAIRYFDFPTKNFDPQVFDLYMEMGSQGVINERVNAEVELSLNNLRPMLSDTHILLTNKLSPRFVTSIDKIRTLQRRLAQALADVQAGKSDKDRKQKLLDLSDRVRQFQARHIKSEEHQSDDDGDQILDDALKNYSLGVLMLGSGAETLVAEEKRKIAINLIKLGAAITDVWTNRITSINFEEIKSMLLSDEFFDDFLKENGNNLTQDEIRATISSLVDDIEGAALYGPLRTVLGLVCNQSNAPVLVKSLKNVEPDTQISSLVHAIWLTDLSVRDGKGLMLSLSKSLPNVQFLRACVAMHCQSRSFWVHWRKKDRIDLLEIAEKFLKPISVKINKGEILRQISRD